MSPSEPTFEHASDRGRVVKLPTATPAPISRPMRPPEGSLEALRARIAHLRGLLDGAQTHRPSVPRAPDAR